jgi:3-hydroxyisobutyrate dehydrogenase
MCANLVRAGYEVTAGDARAERESAVAGCGARWQATAAEVAAEADVLITVLPGPAEVYEAMAGSGGALAALPPAATWIDMTSSSPAMGRVLLASAQARGISVLEAPAGGGVPEAEAGPGSTSTCCARRWPAAPHPALSSATSSARCSPGTT